ncbi:MAG TPA: hypothetical protein EYP40_11180 [Chromatiales bacterium]|nr:hypothetical protein [Chromatiales bacterium]
MPRSSRLVLSVLLKLLILAGLLVAALPFLASLGTRPEASLETNPWYVEIDVADLPPGEIRRVAWPGGEVWIYRRGPDEIRRLGTDTAAVRDPAPVPAGVRGALFVFQPRETRRGCQVHLTELADGRPGFAEPCFGARFDTAGRILRGSGHPEQGNLPVPPHEFIGAGRLRLLPPSAS